MGVLCSHLSLYLLSKESLPDVLQFHRPLCAPNHPKKHIHRPIGFKPCFEFGFFSISFNQAPAEYGPCWFYQRKPVTTTGFDLLKISNKKKCANGISWKFNGLLNSSLNPSVHFQFSTKKFQFSWRSLQLKGKSIPWGRKNERKRYSFPV